MAIETNRVAYEGETASKSSSLREPERHGTYETEQTEHKIIAGGIGLAALLGLVSVVLAILGLVNVAPFYMAGISAVALGVALLLAGGFSMQWFTAPREHFFYEGEGAMSTEVMAGVAGIVLGLLALLGVVPGILLPVSVLAFGISLFMSSWVGATHFSGIKCLTGLSGIVLGILALTVVSPIALILTGFLTLGFGTLFSGSIMSSKYMYAAHGA
ncbi:MAG: hypothetical protein ACXWJB_05395 [Limisphaerales bacterium]